MAGGTSFVKYYAGVDFVREGDLFRDFANGRDYKTGYGYNFVPSKGWLLHISALPTFIVYSNTSAKIGDDNVPMKYHFPEVIITGRGAVVRNARAVFYGLSMNFNFTNIGNKDNLAVHNVKWYLRTFFGLRL